MIKGGKMVSQKRPNRRARTDVKQVLPDKLILKAKGTKMFEENADIIGPILNYYINGKESNICLNLRRSYMDRSER